MMKGDAISHIVQFDGSNGALPLPVSASVAHLKVNGTDTVASLAISSRTTDQTTRIFRSARSVGQIYGQRWTRVPIRLACSTAVLAGGSVASGGNDESVSAITREPGILRSRELPF